MIRVFFGDTWADLPEETPADPYGPPGDGEKPLALEWARNYDARQAFVFHGGAWVVGRVETWPEEAKRLRAERDAAANALRKYRDAGDYEKDMAFPERARILGEARRMSAEALAIIDGKDG